MLWFPCFRKQEAVDSMKALSRRLMNTVADRMAPAVVADPEPVERATKETRGSLGYRSPRPNLPRRNPHSDGQVAGRVS
jgi:hypothetical protein